MFTEKSDSYFLFDKKKKKILELYTQHILEAERELVMQIVAY